MPYTRADDAVYKAVAGMLREMADILERHPEDVVSMDYNITTDYVTLIHGSGPLDKTFNVTIQTRNIRKE